MKSYDIKRWDVVQFGNSVTKVPMIYVKPDLELIEFFKENDFAVMCDIQNTDKIYDGKSIPGLVDKSCEIPSFRPVFYEKTGYYVISLWSDWYGYPLPSKLGTVTFPGMTTDENTEIDPVESTKDKNTSQDNQTLEGYDTFTIICILLFICIIYLYLKDSKS